MTTTYNSKLVRVVGHINPDLDCVASSICYSYLKNQITDTKDFAPFIGNEMTHQAREVLAQLGIESPATLDTLKLQASDILQPAEWSIHEDISMLEALTIMKEAQVRSLPVINDNKELCGVFTESNVTDNIIQTFVGSLSNIPVTIPLIKKTLKVSELFTPKNQIPLSNRIITCALDKSKIKERFNKGDIAIIADRQDVIDILLDREVAIIILTNSSILTPEIMKLFKRRSTILFSTPFDTFQTGKLISIAVPVKEFMITEPLVLRSESFADIVKKYALKSKYAVPVIDAEKKVIGVIGRSDMVNPRYKKVIMMDHNEKSQAVEGIDEAEIIEIIDHHRFSGISTDSPIYINTKPYGSTSTMVAESFIESQIDIPAKHAKLLLAAICSDTLLFLSPTSTTQDYDIASKLAEIGDVEIGSFGRQVLEAADVSAAMSPDEMLENDRKQFLFNQTKINIAQLETTSYKWLEKIKVKLLEAMDNQLAHSGSDAILLMVTHVLKKETRLLVRCRDRFYIEDTFEKTIHHDEIFLPGVVSRKKQIVPYFSKKQT